jgi:hypothetical protein
MEALVLMILPNKAAEANLYDRLIGKVMVFFKWNKRRVKFRQNAVEGRKI